MLRTGTGWSILPAWRNPWLSGGFSGDREYRRACASALERKKKSLKRTPGWNAMERRSTNRTSPTITTPRSMRRSLSCHRKRHERVRELRRNHPDKLDGLRLSRLYLRAESVSATCGFVKKLGMKKAPDSTVGGLREMCLCY